MILQIKVCIEVSEFIEVIESWQIDKSNSVPLLISQSIQNKLQKQILLNLKNVYRGTNKTNF